MSTKKKSLSAPNLRAGPEFFMILKSSSISCIFFKLYPTFLITSREYKKLIKAYFKALTVYLKTFPFQMILS